MRSTRRIISGAIAVSLAWGLASCGKSSRRGANGPEGDAGEPAIATLGGSGGTGSIVGGASHVAGTGELVGGGAGKPHLGGAGEGGASEGGASSGCVEGAACRCGDLAGTVRCDDSADAEGECHCPDAELCEVAPRQCFEPCGGNPLGVWVLERSCVDSSSEGLDCAGAVLDAVPVEESLRVAIFENGGTQVVGGEWLDVSARVPLECLGIESVARCGEVTFYAAPLLYQLSLPLNCEANACGHCDCSASLAASPLFQRAKPWAPGDTHLAFGAVEVPYCVEGDMLWVGGVSRGGALKVSYQFRRRSCTGSPTPCSERSDDACGPSCILGRCVTASGGDPAQCAALEDDFVLCRLTSGCEWDPTGCRGTAAERCTFSDCDATPGCVWGESEARCGGEPTHCFQRDVATCSDSPGCAPLTCFRETREDIAQCQLLTTAGDCGKAVGCTWSGNACTGVTECGKQTDADVCSTLQCQSSETPICMGFPTRVCSDFSVEDCHVEPGCRLEW